MKLDALIVATFGILLSLGSATAQQAGKVPRIGYKQHATYVLAINLKTAKALGMTVPRTLLLLADHVVE